MTEKIAEQLALAERRNREIPVRIVEGKVHSAPRWCKTWLMRGVTYLYAHLDLKNVQGVENLKKAEDLSQDSRLLITQNHQTDLDHAGKRMFLEKLGFRKLANRLIYAAGLKMEERWWIRRFMGAEHVVFIPTPADLEDVGTVLSQDKKEHFLEEEQRSSLEKYGKNLRVLGSKANELFTDLTQSGSLVTALYPEATRSRHSKSLIQRAPASVAMYTLVREGDPDLYILPVSVTGLHEFLPPKKFPRLWKFFPHFIPIKFMQRASMKVVIGEAYPASEIWDKRRVKALKDMGAEKSDYMMAKIAILNPELVEPEELDFYKRVLAA